MKTSKIEISESFKKQTIRSILSILLFSISFLFILTLGIALSALCIFLGVQLILTIVNSLTIILGLGIAGIGVILLMFLFKFIFSSNKTDNSHLLQIYETDEPELFQTIDQLTKNIDTHFPKKIYLSPEVNAYVFYNSTWLSIFFPTKKNLVIGIGLINSVTRDELKAILAHEFGHFSQSSMKIGSIIYQFNQVTYNLLFDNQSFSNWIDKWANMSSVFAFFTYISIKIIQGIQWILQKLYEIVNKSYMALSKEMEYHADEIAVRTVGSTPMRTALMRIEFSQFAFQQTHNFYAEYENNQLTSKNMFLEHEYLTSFYANENEMKIENGFPMVELKDHNKFMFSKLNFEDQWSSHPTLHERIQKIDSYGLKTIATDNEPANTLFKQITKYQEYFTQQAFQKNIPQDQLQFVEIEDFKTRFEKRHFNNKFPEIYNGYYDRYSPVRFELATSHDTADNHSLKDLFSDEKVQLIYETEAMAQDAVVLKQIYMNEITVKTFEYDGVKYDQDDSIQIQTRLDKEVKSNKEFILKNDINIYQFFTSIELKNSISPQIKDMYLALFEFDEWLTKQQELYNNISEALGFLNSNMTVRDAIENFMHVRTFEKELKISIQKIMDDPSYKDEIDANVIENFNKYLSEEWRYIENEELQSDRLTVFLSSLDTFIQYANYGIFLKKKALLKHQAQIISADENIQN